MKRITIAVAIAAGLLGLAATPAFAQQGAAAKKDVEAKIDARLTRLAALHARVDTSQDASAEHKAALDSILDQETSGLTSLRAQVDAATDPVTIAGYARSMVEDYRVYLVVTPQVHLLLATDVGEHVIGVANTTIAPKLTDAIARAEANGKDVTQARQDDAAFTTAVAAAGNDLDGLDATLLALTPHGYPANRQSILDARAKVADARAKLAEARAAAHQVILDLKAA